MGRFSDISPDYTSVPVQDMATADQIAKTYARLKAEYEAAQCNKALVDEFKRNEVVGFPMGPHMEDAVVEWDKGIDTGVQAHVNWDEKISEAREAFEESFKAKMAADARQREEAYGKRLRAAQTSASAFILDDRDLYPVQMNGLKDPVTQIPLDDWKKSHELNPQILADERTHQEEIARQKAVHMTRELERLGWAGNLRSMLPPIDPANIQPSAFTQSKPSAGNPFDPSTTALPTGKFDYDEFSKIVHEITRQQSQNSTIQVKRVPLQPLFSPHQFQMDITEPTSPAEIAEHLRQSMQELIDETNEREVICGFPMGPDDFKDCRGTNDD